MFAETVVRRSQTTVSYRNISYCCFFRKYSIISIDCYASFGQNPVSYADPSRHFASHGMCFLTMSADNLVSEIRKTMSAGMLGALNGFLTAASNGDTDLTTAIFKEYSFGIAGVGLGYLKELGQAVNSAKLLYVVGQTCYELL